MDKKEHKGTKIVGFNNVSTRGLWLEFDTPISMNGGLRCKQWWVSWEKLSELIFGK